MNFTSVTSLFTQNPKRTVLAILALIAVAGYSATSLFTAEDGEEIEELPQLVSVTSAAAFADESPLSLIGTARALSEAEITAEQSGRVTSVSTTLGASVVAGQRIATLENARERAAVLQAEGAYEAALAASAQSTIGVSEANNNLRNTENAVRATLVSSYDTVNDIVLNTIDGFFTNPQTIFPGLRIDGKNYTETLNQERIAFQTILPSWQTQVQQLSATSDLNNAIDIALTNTSRTIGFLDTFITVFSIQSNSSRYSDEELTVFRENFTNAKASLVATRSALNASVTNLNAAKDAVLRAETAASGGATSAADAQVKQALGVLRSAQANLAKTILTTPISGTVNSLSVTVGDYVSGGTKVAVVANNQALEIITYVSDTDRSNLAIGDVMVINDIATATVRQIAPAIDPATRKIEVRLVTESANIKNGDTVTLSATKKTTAADTTVKVPITAIKFEVTDGHVFIVEDSVLVRLPVVIGQISGNSVEILNGLMSDQLFVVDARGLQAGDQVSVRE